MIRIADASRHLAEEPACRALLAAWVEWAGDKPIPLVEDVRPELIGGYIPNVTVFNVAEDGSMGYSLAGGRHRDLMQRDLRGWQLQDVTPLNEREERLRRMRPIIEMPCGMIARGSLLRVSGKATLYTTLTLPVRALAGARPSKAYLAIDEGGLLSSGEEDRKSVV